MSTVSERFETWLGIEVWRPPVWHTRKEIAGFMECTKSPTLIEVLSSAVDKGILETRVVHPSQGSRGTVQYIITHQYQDSVLLEAIHGSA